jgi:hypothetical protein
VAEAARPGEVTVDVAVIGAGPAGVSAARRLCTTGSTAALMYPEEPRRLTREADTWSGLLAKDRAFDALIGRDWSGFQGGGSSPKLRVAALAPVFEGWHGASVAGATGLEAAGSRSFGGLASAWGAGVAALPDSELKGFPVSRGELAPWYREVAGRVPVATAGDAVAEALWPGLPSGPPLRPSRLARRIVEQGPSRTRGMRGVTLGVPPLAVRTGNDPSACDYRKLCLIGCPRGAIYDPAQEHGFLAAHPSLTLLREAAVTLRREGDGWRVSGAGGTEVVCRAVLVAAGAINSFALLARSGLLQRTETVLRSTPSAGFAVLVPSLSAAAHPGEHSTLAQAACMVEDVYQGFVAWSALFPVSGLPTYEFLERGGLRLTSSFRLMPMLLPFLLAGNVFLPSELAEHRLRLAADGRVELEGGLRPELPEVAKATLRRVNQALRACGAYVVPGSLTLAAAGSDLHYGGSVHGAAPLTSEGELGAGSGVYVADAAAFPRVSALPHTFTIMAWAERVAHQAAGRIKESA